MASSTNAAAAAAAIDAPSAKSWSIVAQSDLDKAADAGLIDQDATAYAKKATTAQFDSDGNTVQVVLDLSNFDNKGIKLISIRSMLAIIMEIITNGTPSPDSDKRFRLPPLPDCVYDVLNKFACWINGIKVPEANRFVSEIYIEISQKNESDKADLPYHKAGFPSLMWILVAKTRVLKTMLKNNKNPKLDEFKTQVDDINGVLDKFYEEYGTTIVKYVSYFLFKKAEERRAAQLNKGTHNYMIPTLPTASSSASPKRSMTAASAPKVARLPFPATSKSADKQ